MLVLAHPHEIYFCYGAHCFLSPSPDPGKFKMTWHFPLWSCMSKRKEENRKEWDSFSDASTGCAVAPVKSRSKQGALSCMTPLTSTASTPTLQGQQQETKPNLTKITLRWQLWGPLSPRSPCWSIKYLASWFQGPPTAAQMQVEHRVKDSSLVIISALLVLVTIFLSVRSN